MTVITVIITILMANPLLFCVRNVHIALGDYFADENSKVLYRVGFMTNIFKDTDCIANLKLVLTFPDTNIVHFEPTNDTRHYSFHDNIVVNKPNSPIGDFFDIDRTFGFIELSDLSNPNEFTYHFEYKGQKVRGPFKFKTSILSAPTEAKIISFGDHDHIVGTPIMSRLKDYDMDLMILLGDYAYDIYSENGKRGDDYFDAMEVLFTRVPIALAMGNHERIDNFNFFANRFIFPLTKTKASVHNFHFIINNTLFIVLNFDQVSASNEQYKKILQYVQQTLEDSTKNPTIIHRLFFAHRPFLCTNYLLEPAGYPAECQIYSIMYKQFDDLLQKYNVEIAFTAHQHYYERSYPLFNFQKDDEGINYLIVGSGGNDELWQKIDLSKAEFKAAEVQQMVGYTETQITDAAIYCNFVNAENGVILDSFSVGDDKFNIVLWCLLGLTVVSAVAIYFYLRKPAAPGNDNLDNQQELSVELNH